MTQCFTQQSGLSLRDLYEYRDVGFGCLEPVGPDSRPDKPQTLGRTILKAEAPCFLIHSRRPQV